MTFRILFSIVIGLILLGAGYFDGYVRGHRAAMHNEVIFDLRHGLTLYRLEQRGDTNQLDSKLRFRYTPILIIMTGILAARK
jgi:hypothetical protein